MESSNPAPRFPARPRIVPVIDVTGGRVVRAIGGRRDEYQPVESGLTNSTEPVAVARALLEASGANELYVADLDAIRFGILSDAVVELVAQIPVTWIVDAGCLAPTVHTERVRRVIPCEVDVTPEQARDFARMPGHPAGAVFSLDLMHGSLRGPWRRWGVKHDRDWRGVVRRAYRIGFRSLIVLDVARVGTGRGVGTGDTCRAIRSEFRGVEVFTGGGVRGWGDVEDVPADAVLVASALHDGSITFPRPAA